METGLALSEWLLLSLAAVALAATCCWDVPLSCVSGLALEAQQVAPVGLSREIDRLEAEPSGRASTS